jgi:uncharacterized protein (TIGR02453 family)
MIQQSTLNFLKALQKNNNKHWFDANRKKYDEARADFVLLTEMIINTVAGFDKSIAGLEAKKCIFRINRDVRFSKDKSPYKTNMGASFNKGGKKIQNGGYYFHCEPGQSFLAAGVYMPMPDDLNKIRQEIDYNFDRWKKIISRKSFVKTFPNGFTDTESLARPPKGYEAGNPAIEFLKLKHIVVSHPLTDAQLTDKKLLKTIEAVFKEVKPMIDFLNEAIA